MIGGVAEQHHHTYHFEPLGPDSSRFGSWEVAEGASYRLMRRFWLAHFRFVRDQSLAGARKLGERENVI